MSNEITRRDILRGSAAAVVGLTVGTGAIASAAAEPQMRRNGSGPGSGVRKLKFGIIGAGGKGTSGTEQAAQFGDIVALCDVDATTRATASANYPRASTFNDYRDMFEAMRGKINAVVISTPDHHHAIASAIAMRQGLHCYTEKPLTRTIWEARQLARIARETGVATQMGNQSTASTNMRKTAALIRSGAFGKVKEVHLWTNRAAAYWKQGLERPAPARPPKQLDFQTWLGPAEDRPYAEGYHTFAWRGWWAFGTGALGDMGCHIFNMAYMALDLRDPIAVQAKTSGHNRDSFPVSSVVTYEFPERNGRPAVKLFWHDGGEKPAASVLPGVTLGGNGAIVVCEKDTVYTLDESNTNFKLLSGAKIPDVDVDVSPGHMAEFARAALGGQPARSNFPDYSGPLTETVLLGNLAIWANGPRLEWDSRSMRVKGSNEYDALIRPTYRKNWTL